MKMTKIFIGYIMILMFVYIKCDGECSRTICNPRAGDLLIGRESLLSASSTCGLQLSERYCVLTLADKNHAKCLVCDSKNRYNRFSSPHSHRIENVVSRLPQDPGRWWQSSSGLHNISIEITFETEFQFIFTQLRFKTYRPAAMYIERSKDYGYTWQTSAYFSDNCDRDFPGVPERNRNDITEVSCTSEFSSISPSEGGTVLFMATPSDLHIYDNDWIEKRNNITAITNIRVQFVRLHTFGDWKIDNNPTILNKYYYGLSEWIIRGRCSCYGHASKCQPKEGQMQRKEMVYGVCVCQHNTMGQHCEKCKDFFNDKPWEPAEFNSTNECKRCDCNSHSMTCHFNPVIYYVSGKKRGGECDNCLHNTEGQNCQHCKSGYYRHQGVNINSPDTCLQCKCDPYGSAYPNICTSETSNEQSLIAGSCICKENVDGFYCDKCKTGYWKFDKNDEKGCSKCKCLMMGTIQNQGCDFTNGKCFCKANVEGTFCNICKNKYYNLTSLNPLGCSDCGCDPRRSLSSGICDKSNGQCQCIKGYDGRTCNEIKKGWFIDSPRYSLNYGRGTTIVLPPVSKYGFYNFIITMDTQQMLIVDSHTIFLTISQNNQNRCPNHEETITITKESTKILIVNKCLVEDLSITIDMFVIAGSSDEANAATVIDVEVIPMLFPDSNSTRNTLAECLQYPPASMPPRCNFLKVDSSSRAMPNSNPKVCNCNVTGSVNNVCEHLGGQCHCLPNVIGRKCDQCDIHSYGFDARGCKNCNCEPQGSLNLLCALDTGKCLCRAGVEGRNCNYCKSGFFKFPFCDPCKCNSMTDICDQNTGECINCKANSFGFNCQQCNNGFYGDPSKNLPCLKCNCPGLSLDLNHSVKCSLNFNKTSHMCVCKPGYKGTFCDECDDNYFGNPRERDGSCYPCHCSANIDRTVPGSCDQRTGECKKCQYNTAGFNCEKCAFGYFGDALSRTCKKCVCNSLGTTLKVAEKCHHETGKCPCLPNVYGQQCDKCFAGFFNISSGRGCLACECDSSNGAINQMCNSLTGQCHCRESRSGRQCDKCEDGYWGNPKLHQGCKICLCNMEGSLFNQCDRNNGACRCKPGIDGRYCDRCARGTDGEMPNCSICGDCWLQWDETIQRIIISLEQLQNGTVDPKSPEGLPGGLFTIVNNINNYILSMVPIIKNIPEDLQAQIKQLRIYVTKLKNELAEIDLTKFDISQYDSINITKAIADLKEIVESNKIQDSRGAYDIILKSFQLIKDAIHNTWEEMKVVEKMKRKVSSQEKEISLINMEKLERKSEDLVELEQNLTGDLIKFNELTCNAETGPQSILCSSNCGGVGCQPNNCSRRSAAVCFKNGSSNFFNARAWKVNNKINPDLEEIKRNLQKDFNGKFKETETDISAAMRLIGVTNSTINKRYNRALKLLEKLNNMENNYVSEEEFKKLLESINNFKLSSHEEEIKAMEQKIKERLQQLDNKVERILTKSEENRKECDLLKDRAMTAKKDANSLLNSIKDLEGHHVLVIEIHSKTKSVIFNLSIHNIQINDNLKEIIRIQNQTETNQKIFDDIMKDLKYSSEQIKDMTKKVEDKLKVLEEEQESITKKLEDIKRREKNAIQKKEFLNENRNKKKSLNEDARKKLLEQIEILNKRLKETQENITNSKNSVDLKQSNLRILSVKVEEKLQRMSSLENEIYAKSEFQRSCLP